MYSSAAARDAEIALGATLPARALRTLFHHTVVHLNVEWRDLTENGWSAPLRTVEGSGLTARDTPLLRARDVWQAAVDLDNGVRRADLPAALRKGGGA